MMPVRIPDAFIIQTIAIKAKGDAMGAITHINQLQRITLAINPSSIHNITEETIPNVLHEDISTIQGKPFGVSGYRVKYNGSHLEPTKDPAGTEYKEYEVTKELLLRIEYSGTHPDRNAPNNDLTSIRVVYSPWTTEELLQVLKDGQK